MIQLYDAKPIVGQSFVGCKRMTVPKQSLSLREIVRRFVRRESVPVSQEGLYETRFGDLEKLSKGDIYDQMEHVELLKSQIAEGTARENANAEKLASEEAEKSRLAIIDAYEKSKVPPSVPDK